MEREKNRLYIKDAYKAYDQGHNNQRQLRTKGKFKEM